MISFLNTTVMLIALVGLGAVMFMRHRSRLQPKPVLRRIPIGDRFVTVTDSQFREIVGLLHPAIADRLLARYDLMVECTSPIDPSYVVAVGLQTATTTWLSRQHGGRRANGGPAWSR